MQLFQCCQYEKRRFLPGFIVTLRFIDNAFIFPMTRRNWQAQDYLILDKGNNIQFRRCQDAINRCVRVETSKFTLVLCEQEIRMQIQSIRNPSEASLAPHAHQSLDAYLQNRGAVRFMNARD